MQQGTFGGFFVGAAPSPLSLHSGTRTKHLDVAAVTDIEECCAVDPARNREFIVHRAAQRLGVEPNGRVEIHCADRDMMEGRFGAQSVHCFVPSTTSPTFC